MGWGFVPRRDCGLPVLKKFQGRPRDLSPKARINTWLGYNAPFDRHDWVVSRCGKDVRYIIDFYQGSSTPGDSRVAMHLDVRPALDSVGAVWDRVRMAVGTPPQWDDALATQQEAAQRAQATTPAAAPQAQQPTP